MVGITPRHIVSLDNFSYPLFLLFPCLGATTVFVRRKKSLDAIIHPNHPKHTPLCKSNCSSRDTFSLSPLPSLLSHNLSYLYTLPIILHYTISFRLYLYRLVSLLCYLFGCVWGFYGGRACILGGVFGVDENKMYSDDRSELTYDGRRAASGTEFHYVWCVCFFYLHRGDGCPLGTTCPFFLFFALYNHRDD